jgi:hypothetical protein
MKKILFSGLFCILSIIAFSQSKVETYKNQVGYWNTYKEEWEWDKAVFNNITFTLGKNYITCNDEAKSFYSVKEDLGDDKSSTYKGHGWKCIDEKGRNCIVQVILYTEYNLSVIHVMYNNKAIRYYVYRREYLSDLD